MFGLHANFAGSLLILGNSFAETIISVFSLWQRLILKVLFALLFDSSLK